MVSRSIRTSASSLVVVTGSYSSLPRMLLAVDAYRDCLGVPDPVRPLAARSGASAARAGGR